MQRFLVLASEPALYEGMRHAFIFEGIAVLVGPWHEPMDPPERGARVEVRRLGDEPRRGTRFAAQKVVIDQPLFRADLFDQVDQPPVNLRAAHFHPRFDDVEPCDRVWKEEIQKEPMRWLVSELEDLPGLIERSAVDVAHADWVERDAKELRSAIPSIIDAVKATWRDVRAEEA
jgi:hypothetical protein